MKSKGILFFFAFLMMQSLFAKTSKLEHFEYTVTPDNTRLVLELSQEASYKVFTLDKPNRLVIDLQNTQLKAKLKSLQFENTPITNIRYAHHPDGQLRIVFDVSEVIKPKSFTLKNRLIIDLPHKTPKVIAKKPDTQTTKEKVIEAKVPSTEFVVAIDPGHGGDDTGAIGNHKQLKEKDVVFAVSKKLSALINAQPGMRAYLVRQGDYYIGLRKRMVLAREQGADLFISIHADSFKDPKASGASVYVLSEKGASNEAARWLAERENRADLIGGVSLEDKGNVLASVLLDLSQTHSQHASNELASHLIKNLGKVTDLHHKSVQRAGFMVLKSPDIPSVLVELGFISNQIGEKKLLSKQHQQQLANALLAGIQSYASKRAVPQVNQEMNVAAR